MVFMEPGPRLVLNLTSIPRLFAWHVPALCLPSLCQVPCCALRTVAAEGILLIKNGS